ncbi:hypothetical protein [Actinoplanes sp. G11-F43]|uniref:hypothetical protein n=1 Tax=Actinoplanes sp. G11-F43 TaxID=3424130 RepID=UPI003D341FEC
MADGDGEIEATGAGAVGVGTGGISQSQSGSPGRGGAPSTVPAPGLTVFSLVRVVTGACGAVMRGAAEAVGAGACGVIAAVRARRAVVGTAPIPASVSGTSVTSVEGDGRGAAAIAGGSVIRSARVVVATR